MDFETLPPYWINHLSFQIRKELETRFSVLGHKISAEEWAMLLILKKNGALNLTDLSKLTLRDTTTVSRLIDRLERKGLIVRNRNAEDRRIVHVQMTDAGRRLFAELAGIAQDLIGTSLAGLTAKDIETAIRVMRKMSENLSSSKRKADV